MKKPVTILGIESSCDDTAAAVLQSNIAQGDYNTIRLLSNITASQSVHRSYGGVVPELASRAHQQHIVPVVNQALTQAGITKSMLNAVAFTQGPGLLGSLLVGSSFAKSLAYALEVPLIAVNHMQAHILAHFIEKPHPNFPFLCLTVSGGHTQIVLVEDYLTMSILGQTLDDAVGEAFDKAAKLMNLPYPGGPLIDKYAKEGNPDTFGFPITKMPNLDYSFSGIKTAFLNFLSKHQQKNPNFVKENLADICASIQQTLIRMLMEKLEMAVKQTNIREVAIAGGVSANTALRKAIQLKAKEDQWNIFIPKMEYCTDNAAMIAMAAHFLYAANDFSPLSRQPRSKAIFLVLSSKI